MRVRSRSPASRSAAGPIRRVWNGALTASGTARRAPCVRAAATTSLTAGATPPITTWPGLLKFDGSTTPRCACASHSARTWSGVSPITATIMVSCPWVASSM